VLYLFVNLDLNW